MLGVILLGLLAVGLYLFEQGAQGPLTIASYARNAGWEGADLLTAVAIAYAESSGNPNAVGDVNLGRSIGLWQINLAAHPEYQEQELYDPQTNANAAYAIWSAAGGSFSPWTTFKTGAYNQYLPQASDDTGIDYEDDDNG